MVSSLNMDKPFESAVRAISKVLPKSSYEYIKLYSGRSLEIVPKNIEEETRLYIRLLYVRGEYIIDLSNVQLDESIRRRGIFTNIVNKLKKSKTLNGIWVSSTFTEEIHRACRKNKMVYSEDIQGYKLEIW